MRLHDFFDFRVREQPEREFATQGRRSLTYGQAAAEVNRLGNALLDSGLKNGDRIAILSRNSIEYLLLYLAASRTGVVPVLLNYRLAPPEWRFILEDSGARLLLVETPYCEGVDSLRPELAGVREYLSLGGTYPGWGDLESWSGRHSSRPPRSEVTPGDDAYQMYTSGTTGRPKGAVITHASATLNAVQVMHCLPGQSPGDRYLLVAPVYHAAAAITFFSSLLAGNALYVQEDFIPEEVVRALSEEGLAGALLVPAMIQACLVEVPDVAKRSYDRLRVIVYGASPISEHTLRRAMEIFECDFIQGYGMTETTAVMTMLSREDHRRAVEGRPELLASAGRPLMGTEVRIVDEADNSLPPGRVGQIVARGPQLMRGYWNLPRATEEALAGGWMHTGDAGKMDEEGYVYILDRVKDMIVSGGENIYPRVVEDVLFQHPDVADVAVIGVPDEKWGETVKAVVVRRCGCRTEPDDFIRFCRGKLGGFQIPTSVDFLEELPRNPSGKVLKRVLRESYWKDQTRRVAGS